MLRALRLLDSSGLLPWDFEDRMGLQGAALDNVLGGLQRRGLIGDEGFAPTQAGLELLK